MQNFDAAADLYGTTLYLHRNELYKTERLNSLDLVELSKIDSALRKHFQQHSKSPVPVQPSEVILVAQRQSCPQNDGGEIQFQQTPMQHPDLMSFDEVPSNDQDFIPGV